VKEANSTEKATTVSPLEAILVIVVTFFLSLFLGAIFLLVLGTGPTLVLGELLVLIVPLSYLLLKHIDVKSFIGLNIKPQLILLGIASGALIFLLDIVVSNAFTTIFGVSQTVEASNKIISDLTSSTPGLIFVVTSLSLTGFCEEFAFRGFLQNTINRKYSFIPAVIVSSVAFGIFHFDPQFVYTLSTIIMGLALGYIYYRYKSYVVSAIAHTTLNLIVLAILLLAL
jgi:membrane protease YdiL (CAAX protease family)